MRFMKFNSTSDRGDKMPGRWYLGAVLGVVLVGLIIDYKTDKGFFNAKNKWKKWKFFWNNNDKDDDDDILERQLLRVKLSRDDIDYHNNDNDNNNDNDDFIYGENFDNDNDNVNNNNNE